MRLEPEARPPIGYFPLGTANDVATTLRLPKGDSAGLRQAHSWRGSPTPGTWATSATDATLPMCRFRRLYGREL